MMDINNRGRSILQIQQCFVMLFLLVASSMNIYAQSKNLDMSRELPLDTLVRFGRLENGFTYYLRRNDSLERRVQMTLVVNAGSANENPDQLEYAHLLEHVGTTSTKHFPVLHDYFRRDGRKSHGNTSPNYTRYYTDIGTEDPEVIKNGLLALRDQAHDISMDQEIIDVQRGAVLGEMRTNNPYQTWTFGIIGKYSGNSFGDPKLNKKSVEEFNRNAFLQFYEDWYQPQHQAAIVVGNIQLDSVEKEIKNLFADLKNKEKSVNAFVFARAHHEELDGKNHFMTVLDTLQGQTKLYVVNKKRNYRYGPKTRSDYRNRLLQELYAKIISKRSFHVKQKKTAGVTGFTASFLGSDNVFRNTLAVVDLDTKTGVSTKEQFLEAMAVIKRMHLGITTKELEQAKKEVASEYSVAEMGTNSGLTNQYLNHFLHEAPYLTAMYKKTLLSELLEDIQLTEVQDVALDFADLSKDTYFIYLKSPDAAHIAKAEMERWISLAEKLSVSPMVWPKEINSIVDESHISWRAHGGIRFQNKDIIGATTLMLDNGTKVVLKPSEPLSPIHDRIIVHAYRPNGVPMKDEKDYVIVQEAQNLMNYLGTGSFTSFELDNFMRKNQIRLNYGLDKGHQILHGEVPSGKASELLALMYLYMTEPKFNKEDFEAWSSFIRDQWNGIQNRGSSVFYEAMIEDKWYPNVPNLTMKDLDDLSQKEVLKSYKKWFGDIGGYTFVVTGNFKTERMIDLLTRALPKFPMVEPKLGNGDEFKFPLKQMEETMVIKNSDQAYVNLYFPVMVPRDVKTKAMLTMASKYFSKKAWERLREGCYSPSAGGKWMDEEHGVYAFWVRFDSELGNQDTLIQYALEEFRKVKEHGIDPDWFASAVKEEIKSYGNGLEYFYIFNFWTEYLQQKLILDEDFATEVLQYEALLEYFIDVEDINEAAKAYMQEDYYQQFILLPEDYRPAN